MTWHFGRESPRPLCEGVNVLGWLVTIPRPLGESGFSVGRCRACGSGSTVRKDVNSFPQASKPVRWREAGNFPTPRIIQDREKPCLNRQVKVTDSGEGLNKPNYSNCNAIEGVWLAVARRVAEACCRICI